MSDPTLAKKDPATVLAEALALYKEATKSTTNPTGTTLAPADPRRLHLQAFLLLLAQQRQLIDFSGKQSFLRFVSDLYIEELAALWGEKLIPAKASQCTQQFLFSTGGLHTVPGGARVTDGINIWRVLADTEDTGTVTATVECIVVGNATNGVAIGQIDTLVDPGEVPGCSSTSNITETANGRDLESVEAFRQRLRDVPESDSTCGPRKAYEAHALAVSPTVADAVALGPDDAAEMAGAGPTPGEVFVLVLKGERDTQGVLTSVVPEPDAGLLVDVQAGVDGEEVRPLTDKVTAKAPTWHDHDAVVTYYIARSRSDSAAEIQAAVNDAFDAYLLWQQSKIGRDVNPSALVSRLIVAGAKRAVVTAPTFVALKRDESARITYTFLGYGGIEDD
jgi:phage-related baseplate assembly protein